MFIDLTPRAAAAAALVLLCTGAAICAPQETPPTAQTPPAYRQVTDEIGRTIRVPQNIHRIVSLAPNLTETIYALGLQDRLVGDTDYCDFPPEAQLKAKVGGAINPSLEEIAALKPDVVLVTKLNRMETVQALERLGIASYATDPHSVDEIRSSVHKLAEVLGNSAAGETLDHELELQETRLRERLQNAQPKRVLFVVWTDPLISIGQHTFIADALTHAGATSVVESSQDWPQMSLEEMVRLQPEVLVFASGHSETVSRDVDALANRPGWDALEAVKHRRFAVISEAIDRPAPRLFSAVEDLARQLHPEAFSGGSAPAKNSLRAEKN